MSGEANRNSKIVIIVVVLLVLVGSGIWYAVMYKPAQDAKEKARQEQIAKEEAEQKRIEEAEQQKVKYESLIRDADEAFNQENWETARSLYTEASALFPDLPYPQDQLALVNAKLDELAALATKSAGVVESVSSSTGRYYVIVSSSIDDDLAMDYASKLAKEGNNVKIIEHHANKLPFHGVSLADYATREEAETASASFSTYGGEVWVLRY